MPDSDLQQDPNAPKGARNSYILFSKEQYPSLFAAGRSNKEVIKEVGRLWKVTLCVPRPLSSMCLLTQLLALTSTHPAIEDHTHKHGAEPSTELRTDAGGEGCSVVARQMRTKFSRYDGSRVQLMAEHMQTFFTLFRFVRRPPCQIFLRASHCPLATQPPFTICTFPFRIQEASPEVKSRFAELAAQDRCTAQLPSYCLIINPCPRPSNCGAVRLVTECLQHLLGYHVFCSAPVFGKAQHESMSHLPQFTTVPPIFFDDLMQSTTSQSKSSAATSQEVLSQKSNNSDAVSIDLLPQKSNTSPSRDTHPERELAFETPER